MHDNSDNNSALERRRISRWRLTFRAQLKRIWPFAVAIAAALLGVLFYSLLFPVPLPITQNEIDESIVEAMASATPLPAHSAQVYQMIFPSLVYIQTKVEKLEEEGDVGVGSGVVINDRGEILTALHVVIDATAIEITYADGSRTNAEIVTTEPENDIAVLRAIEPPELIVPAILGNPNAMRIGDETFTVGNPLGLAGSMSAGVISGFDRSISFDEIDQRLEGLIQFDAAVNPGNSGGPLLNRNGQVIGIVTALANPAEQDFFTGIGFAVPINTAVGGIGGPVY